MNGGYTNYNLVWLPENYLTSRPMSFMIHTLMEVWDRVRVRDRVSGKVRVRLRDRVRVRACRLVSPCIYVCL